MDIIEIKRSGRKGPDTKAGGIKYNNPDDKFISFFCIN